jgi:pimeloyl-ACP methyl ester carboxylesterase
MRTIVLLHGALGAKDQFNALSDALTREGFNVFSFSFSGHGTIPFQSQFGIEQFAKELEQFIKDHRLEKPTVFGHSMGGYVALYLAIQQPDLIGKIITLGTKFAWNADVLAKEVKMLTPEIIMEKQPKFGELLQTRHGEAWKMLLQKTSDMMTQLGNKNILGLTEMSSLEIKILIGLGDKDNMVSFDETVAVYKVLKNGAMYVIPETKHPLENVKSELLAKIISTF